MTSNEKYECYERDSKGRFKKEKKKKKKMTPEYQAHKVTESAKKMVSSDPGF